MSVQAWRALILRLLPFGLAAVVLLAPTQHGVEIFRKMHLTLADPLVWLVFGAWLVSAGGPALWRVARLNLMLPVLFVGLAALSLIRTPHAGRSLAKLVQYAEYFLAAYPLFVWGLAHGRARRYAWPAFLAVSVAVTAWGVVHYWRADVEAFQVRATFLNRNVFGGFLALTLPLMGGQLLEAATWPRRVFFLAVVLAGWSVVLSGGTFLALTLAFAVMTMAKGPRCFAAFAVLLLALSFFLLPRLPRQNPDVCWESVALFDDDGEVTRRYAEWQAAAEMTREHPGLGVGAGCYQDRIGGFYGIIPVAGGRAAESDSQNLYLVLGASLGLPALAAFGGLLLWAMGRAAGGYLAGASAWERAMRLGALGSLIAFSVNSVWSPLLVRGLGIPLAFVLALATWRREPADRAE